MGAGATVPRDAGAATHQSALAARLQWLAMAMPVSAAGGAAACPGAVEGCPSLAACAARRARRASRSQSQLLPALDSPLWLSMLLPLLLLPPQVLLSMLPAVLPAGLLTQLSSRLQLRLPLAAACRLLTC